jgi:uracil-DNA glycosylase
MGTNQTVQQSLDRLLKQIREKCVCMPELPLGPRPILRARSSAVLLIAGQAPGTRVHETGIPWNDRSGDQLRQWLALTRDEFYNEANIAIIPAGFCYPGRGKSGDLPPRLKCSEMWLPRLLDHLPNVRLTLLVGSYAQRVHLKDRVKENLTETVRAWREYLPEYIVLPHPSFHNIRWQRVNPWFGDEVVPAARQRVHELLKLD